MFRKPVYGDRWSESSLEHAGRVGEEVYLRALSRRVEWTPIKRQFRPYEEDCAKVSLDEAFTSLMDHLRHASDECRKFHCNKLHAKENRDSEQHCLRFHAKAKPQPVRKPITGNPLEQVETVHLVLLEGDYSITAHNLETDAMRTDIVHIKKQPVTLDFTL